MDVRRLADSAPAFLLKVCLEWQLMGWELRGKLFYKEVMREHCLCVCVCVWEHIRPISLKKLQQQRKCCILLLAIYLSHCMLHASISIKHNCNLIHMTLLIITALNPISTTFDKKKTIHDRMLYNTGCHRPNNIHQFFFINPSKCFAIQMVLNCCQLLLRLM